MQGGGSGAPVQNSVERTIFLVVDFDENFNVKKITTKNLKLLNNNLGNKVSTEIIAKSIATPVKNPK